MSEDVRDGGCSNSIAVKRPQMIITQTIEKRDFFINLTKRLQLYMFNQKKKGIYGFIWLAIFGRRRLKLLTR